MSNKTDLPALSEGPDYPPALKELQESHPKKAEVIQAMAHAPTLSRAADISGVSPSTAHTWRRIDPVFQAALEEVRPLFVDSLRDVVHDRAVLGYQKPVLYKGQIQYQRDPRTGDLVLDENFEPMVLMERVHSDRLLERVLEANVPEYARQAASTNVNVAAGDGAQAGGVMVNVNFVDPPDWDTVEWQDNGKPVIDHDESG